MAVVAVIVLIAVLFMTGTVMALAVSSSLHTVDIVTAHDAAHYAAESAVARGVGAIEVAAAIKGNASCPADAPAGINGQGLKIGCYSQQVGGDLDDEGSGWASIPRGQLNPGACVAPIPLPPQTTAWTVIGWRGSGGIRVWTDGNQLGCSSSGGTPCGQSSVFASANVVYVWCQPQTGDRFLHIAGSGAPVDLGTSVVRWAPSGGGVLWTIVGAAGFEVDEADVLLPKQQVLWNTVLP